MSLRQLRKQVEHLETKLLPEKQGISIMDVFEDIWRNNRAQYMEMADDYPELERYVAIFAPDEVPPEWLSGRPRVTDPNRLPPWERPDYKPIELPDISEIRRILGK